MFHSPHGAHYELVDTSLILSCAATLASDGPLADASKLRYSVQPIPHMLVNGTRNRSGTRLKLTIWIRGQTCQLEMSAGRYICSGDTNMY